MTLCRQKWPSMQLNMFQKPAKKAKKRLIWGKSFLVSVKTIFNKRRQMLKRLKTFVGLFWQIFLA